ncbi:SAG-related sequence SRS30C [Toxoplasma gondii VAND]|uniref:SAG-related sequence SRS30C n=2 Tax=Toxoplasma gondii TaxID=5811 RepID=A0A2G8YAM1_TOXGO|nr:SAG-related sequence SRS30C [Toxoplasma gondii VAND]PIM04326.1 SAG-related sequence SRS30C [Toxoplasma gondii COUG]
MGNSSCVRCPGSVTPCRGSQFFRGLGLRMGLTVLALFVSTFVRSGYVSFAVAAKAQGGETPPSDPTCVVEGAVTKCTCRNQTVQNPDVTAIVSEQQNGLQISCNATHLKCAPDNLQDNTVCPATIASLYECKQTSVKTVTSVDINSLLNGSPSLQWQNGDSVPECTSKKLTIPPENFPFVDEKFIVGCIEEGKKDSMKVAVTLQARASATKEQTVTCAFGINSNKVHQTVTLSPEKNSFTLVCGTAGQVLPTKFDENYCVTADKTDAAVSCTEAYGGILPNYEKTWWMKSSNANEYTFKIPDDQFPPEEQKITVGCQKKKISDPNNQTSRSDEKDSSVCTVDVTIAPSAASSASVSAMAILLLSSAGIVSSIVL